MSDSNHSLLKQHLHLDQQLCFPLYAASRLMTRRYKPYLDKLGITYPQYLVLMVLWQEDGLLVKVIGEKLFLNSNTLTPLLKRLAILELLVRKRGIEDEREVFIHLTAAGRRLQQQALCVLAPFSDINDEQKTELQKLKTQLDLLLTMLVDEEAD